MKAVENRTVPAVEIKNIRKGAREAEAQRFSCQQHPAQKEQFVREIKGKELRRRSLNSHMHKINKEHASKDVRPF